MEHNHCNLDKLGLLERTVEAIHTLGTMDSLGEAENRAFAENNLPNGYSRALVDSSLPGVDKAEVDIQDDVDMLVARAGRGALLRGARPEIQIHVRDRKFVDQQVFLAQKKWQDDEASR